MMKKTLICIMLGMMALCLAFSGCFAEGGEADVHEHSWGAWIVTKAPTCGEEGVRTRTCSECGKQESEIIGKSGEHSWGDWKTTKDPNCLSSGLRTRVCSVCGHEENESIPRIEHKWSEWDTVKEPECTQKGAKKRTCSLCGATETQKIKELGHEVAEWTVTKEPTCQKTGERTGNCIRCGKPVTKKLNKVDHEFEAWEITTQATAFSKGKRQAVCRFCKRKKTDEFWPEGVLARKLENNFDAVSALQTALQAEGLYKGEISGVFDKKTEEAVKKAERELDLKQDGIAWPGLQQLLGVMPSDSEGITKRTSGQLLQLEVRQTSPEKKVYRAGDVVEYAWTLTSEAKRSEFRKTRMLHFDGRKAGKQIEEEIQDVGTLKAGESAEGTFTYTVTEADAAAGQFSHGLIARGTIDGKATAANWVVFVQPCGIGGADEEEETADPVDLTITLTVTGAPASGDKYTAGEAVLFLIEVTNNTEKEVTGLSIRDALAEMDEDGYRTVRNVGTLSSGAEVSAEFRYVVTPEDAKNGEIINAASVCWAAGKNKYIEIFSESVKVATAD